MAGLVAHDELSPSRGYKNFYSGVEGAVSAQAGDPQLQRMELDHAPLTSYGINTGITTVGTSTIDDEIKTRSGSDLTITNGSTFHGGLLQLELASVTRRKSLRRSSSATRPSSPLPSKLSPPPPSSIPPPPNQSPALLC